MARMLKLCSLILILCARSSLAFGQHSSNSPPTRSAIVSVVDTHGSAVLDLARENFRVHLNGKPTAIIEAHYSVAPRRIVVLLDTSGSMIGETPQNQKWRIAREALGDLLTQTPGEVPIAMVTFSSQVQDRFDFHEGRAAIAKWLDEHPDGPPRLNRMRTALFDAMLQALQLLHPFQPGDAIYAITDGQENASRTSASQVRSQLLSSDVRVFALLFAESAVADEEQESETSFLNMVGSSGGFAFGVHGHGRPGGPFWQFDYTDDKKNQDTIKSYTRELDILVNGFWTLEFVSPLSSKGCRIRLEIIDREGKRRKDLQFVYPRLRLNHETKP